MTTISDKRPKFYRAIHYPYANRITSTSANEGSVQPEFTIGLSLKQCKKLSDSTKDQYIKLRPPGASGLPYTAKFSCGDAVWRLHGDSCLVTIGPNYVAQVSIEYIPELDDVTDFETSKKLLLAHLKTDNVLFDRLVNETTGIVKTLHALLYDLGTQCAIDLNSGRCMLELWRIACKYNYKITTDFADEINSSELIKHNQLKAIVKQYEKQNRKLEERSIFQRGKYWIKSMVKKNCFEESLKTVFKNHKTTILEMCTSTLKQHIAQLESHRFMLLRKNDIKLFNDLECVLNDSVFKEVLPKIEKKFINQIIHIKLDNRKSIPLVNSVYFHLCKSILEITNRVEKELDINKSLAYENEWKIEGIQNFDNITSISKYYVKQLRVLVNMANYFEPGKITCITEFPYKCQIQLFNSSLLIHKEQYVWLCLVDATMIDIFQGNTERIEAFSTVLEMFYTYISSDESRTESQETVRMMAHNTLEFVAQVQQSTIGNNTVDREILRKQISFITPEFLSDRLVFSRYRDILDVFHNYWQRFNEVLPKLASKLAGEHLKLQVDVLKNHLSIIVSQALNTKEQCDEVIKFFRAYNDLITDMEEMPFEWYVRIPNQTLRNTLLQNGIIHKVQNIHFESENESHQVQNGQYDKFVEFCTNDIPKHYQIEVVKTLLKNIAEIGRKQTWINGDELSPKDQIISTVHLINAVRSSLLYLKEQPDYIDFDKYYEESVKSFSSVIDGSISQDDFIKRVDLIKDSFWYIRNQNSIGIDKALQLFTPDNSNFKGELCKSSFERYNNQFLKYMVDYSKLNTADKIQEIVQDVRNKVTPLHNSMWTTEFKQTLLPEVLAGLGAVWSIQISTDVANSGQWLKPHSIQVLSMFRLLSIDNSSDGVDKHLAQILTGQGKSVVLGLVAAVLALFHHDVIVVCYSRYLADRDSDDFRCLFQKFSIDSKITYKSFENMVADAMNELLIKAKTCINKRIGVLFDNLNKTNVESTPNNTVLLIDEVDVFFMEKLYGNTCNIILTPVVQGLGKVQLQIWTLVQGGCSNVTKEIQSYVQNSNDPEIQELKALMHRPGTYKLLGSCDFGVIEYTNKALLSTEIEKMIEDAKYVNHWSTDGIFNQNFRLDSDGNISKKDDFGVYKTNIFRGYKNLFMYFKLRNKNFVQSANGVDNFGYLILKIAKFSYSKIPENHELILGVTGTLNEMNSYEKDAIRSHYKILQTSIMPSFFGSSNLKFDPQKNFICHQTVIEWRQGIFSRVNAIIDAKRSVIVFFHDETEMAQFRQEFQSQLDRLHEITINTEPKTRDCYITEAGLSRTVTLATFEMGRGVDYKSSLSVEKNGGVHVIQTFFSLDVKEEIQIKGRTARKDNNGSYELIVCQLHLEEQNLISSNSGARTISYARVSNAREQINDAAYQIKAEKLKNANSAHENSMRFYENI